MEVIIHQIKTFSNYIYIFKLIFLIKRYVSHADAHKFLLYKIIQPIHTIAAKNISTCEYT